MSEPREDSAAQATTELVYDGDGAFVAAGSASLRPNGRECKICLKELTGRQRVTHPGACARRVKTLRQWQRRARRRL